MPQYIFEAVATCVIWFEHPSGHRPDTRDARKQEFRKVFEASNDEAAETEAAKLLESFRKGLGDEYKCSTHRSSAGKMKSVLAKVIKEL